MNHLLAHFVHGAAGAFQRLPQFFLRTGLEEIFRDASLNGLLRVGKRIVTRKDNGAQLRMQRHGALHQFQPIHARHAHIRE